MVLASPAVHVGSDGTPPVVLVRVMYCGSGAGRGRVVELRQQFIVFRAVGFRQCLICVDRFPVVRQM